MCMGSLYASQWIQYLNSTCPSLGPPKEHGWRKSKFPQERNSSGSFRAKFPHGVLCLCSVSKAVFYGLSILRNQGAPAPSAIMKAKNKAFPLIQITDDSRNISIALSHTLIPYPLLEQCRLCLCKLCWDSPHHKHHTKAWGQKYARGRNQQSKLEWFPNLIMTALVVWAW